MRFEQLKLPQTILAGVILGFAFMMTVGRGVLWIAKPYTPNLIGYSELGWVKKGHKTVAGGMSGVPRWAGLEAIVSSTTAIANHKLLRLREGQVVELEGSGTIDRGSISLVLFKTNWPAFPPRNEHLGAVRLNDETPSGKIQVTIPENGYYKVSIHHWWENDHSNDVGGAVPLPDYDFVYDVKWRLRRDLEGTVIASN